jgi:5'-deoxynucleotidase YfbR-like HD superfamily hydrolase
MWEEFIETARECQRMDYVWRFGTIPISVPENVSTHSYWVATYSAMIHQSMAPDDVVTLAACVMKAIVHDTQEKESGDFVRTFKYRTKALKREIDEAEKQIVEEFGPSMKALHVASESLTEKCGNGAYVNAVVKAADFMSLHNFMVREIMRGNREIVPFFKRMVSDLDEMIEKSLGATFKVGDSTFVPAVLYKDMMMNAIQVLKTSGFQ